MKRHVRPDATAAYIAPRFSPVFVLSVLLLLVTGSVSARSQSPISDQTIPIPGSGSSEQPSSISAAGEGFGRRVALDGDTAFISAADGVYIFVRSGTLWSQQAKLEASDGAALNVGDIDGDTAVAIHPASNYIDQHGALYVFVRSGTTWTEQAKLTIEAAYPVDFLSGPVELAGDLISVAASSYTNGNYDKPSLVGFAFRRSGNTWTLDEQFYGGGATLDYDLAVTTDLVVLDSDENSPEKRNSVFLYRYSGGTWTGDSLSTFVESDPGIPGTGGFFNPLVSASGDTVAIKGYFYTMATEQYLHDVLYIFRYSGGDWVREAILIPTNSQGDPYDLRNISGVEIDADTLVFAANDPNTGQSGVFSYTRSGSTWSPSGTVWTTPGQLMDLRPVISGDTVLIGVESEGAAYVYTRSGNTWSQQAKLMLTPDPDQLLVNSGFELQFDGTNWKFNQPYSYRQDCGVAYSGFCSLAFTYTNVVKASQNVDLNVHPMVKGDKIRLTGFYYKENSALNRVRMFISYANLPEDQKMISVRQPTDGWKALPQLTARLRATPTRIRVVIEGTADWNDNTYFDDITLVREGSGALLSNRDGTDSLVPLPLPQAPLP